MKKHTQGVILKPSKEIALLQRHHWIFSGAIASMPDCEEGATLPVFSAQGKPLGYGYFNKKKSICGRMLSFGEISPEEGIRTSLERAITMRKRLFPSSEITNSYRLVNAEGDCLPGLIIDRYDGVLVMQISTLGMEKWKSFIVEYLCKELSPQAIYENSTSSVRKEEGLLPVEGFLYGHSASECVILEYGFSFKISLTQGQKTGFFLDHREMRHLVQTISKNKRVLNCFGYSGAFTIYACAGGAKTTKTVDISKSAVEMARTNLNLNGFSEESHQCVEADVFDFLRKEPLDHDLVILDPPAFAKKRQDIVKACRGYKEINRLALQRMPENSILLSCSCSYHVDPKTFQQVLFQAAMEAKREVKIIGRHRLAADHPINIYHPESEYLKSILLWVH
jgi:23S rRNA (cytosine1962-C5)-methyltransferase